MAENKEVNQEAKSLRTSLGQSVEINCFLDGNPRKAYPITLANYGEFIDYVRYVSLEDIASSFMADNGAGLKSMISMVFLDDELDDILMNVNATNYEEFIREVLELQGISFDDKNEGSNKKK